MPFLAGKRGAAILGRAAYPAWLSPEIIANGGQGLAWQFMQTENLSASAEYWRVNRRGSLAEMLADVRNSPATDYDADGTLRNYGVNVSAIPLGVGLVPRGQRTNKCTNYNANPTDTAGVGKAGNANAVLSVVDDSAELAAAGLDDICASGMVFKLDNSLGGATTSYIYSTGFCGNTNPHTISAYMRTVGGAARLILSSSGGTGWGQSDGYVRRSATVTPANSTQQIVIEVAVGAVVYFILNQLEEGSYATPPIVTEGSAATRLADSITVPNFAADAAALGLGDGFAVKAVVDLTRLGEERFLFGFGVDLQNYVTLSLSVGNQVRVSARKNNGTPVTVTQSAAIPTTGVKEISFSALPGGGSVLSVAGLSDVTGGAGFEMPTLTNAVLGASINGGALLNGPLRELQLWRAAA